MSRLALAVVAFVTLAAAPARACTPPEPGTTPPRDEGIDPWVAGLIAAGVVDLVFVGVDIGFAAAGEPLPDLIAGLEIVVGVANIVVGTGYAIGGIIQSGNGSACGGDVGLFAIAPTGFALAGLGAWFFGHALRWLLEEHDGSAAGDAVWRPLVSVSPSAITLGLAGRF